METLKKSPSTLKRQGSNMPSMPKPVMKRQGSSMEARAQIRVLKKQDTRSQLIAAAEQREKLVKAKSMARILTNEDTQVFAAGKLMKTLSSRFAPGLNEESQKEASARRTHNTKNHINHAKYQVEKKPTPVGTLAESGPLVGSVAARHTGGCWVWPALPTKQTPSHHSARLQGPQRRHKAAPEPPTLHLQS